MPQASPCRLMLRPIPLMRQSTPAKLGTNDLNRRAAVQTIFLGLTAVLLATLTSFGVGAVEADSQGLRERVAALVTEHITIASDSPGITL